MACSIHGDADDGQFNMAAMLLKAALAVDDRRRVVLSRLDIEEPPAVGALHFKGVGRHDALASRSWRFILRAASRRTRSPSSDSGCRSRRAMTAVHSAPVRVTDTSRWENGFMVAP